jgi:hypothetical protein
MKIDYNFAKVTNSLYLLSLLLYLNGYCFVLIFSIIQYFWLKLSPIENAIDLHTRSI